MTAAVNTQLAPATATQSVCPRTRLGRPTADGEEALDAGLRVAHYVVLRIDMPSFAVVGILTSGLQRRRWFERAHRHRKWTIR